MLHFARWQTILILGICFLGIVFALPNVLPESVRKSLPAFVPSQPVPLGLDLRGGAYMLLEAQVDDAVKERTNTLLDDVRKALRNAKILYSGLAVAPTNDALSVHIIELPKLDDATAVLKKLVQPSGIAFGLGNSSGEFDVVPREDGLVTMTLSRSGREDLRQRIMEQSIEVVRRRVDPTGSTEASFARQGERRILLQVPGVADTTALEKVLNTVAKLTFHMVDETVSEADIAAKRVPPGDKLLNEKIVRGNQTTQVPIVVKERAIITGDMLERAQGIIDGQTQQPVVSFKFNAQGARRFADITRDNVGRRFAAVLDEEVITAPVIRSPILGGQGQIEGNFTIQEANDLAVLLNAGALPVPLKILEQRTVGPEMGLDAIRAGQLSALGGLLLVVGFMLLQYRLFGVFATVALVMNLILLLAAMTIFRATLTLPGIAGFVLTMGMAVDANVLIYERMKEEIRNGRTIMSAIDAGFSRAMATIIDANATHLLAGLILLGLGSGPIGGFAVALTLGIISSFFTSIFVTRIQVIWWLHGRRPAALPI
jgi:protein-export membrane protein SecD